MIQGLVRRQRLWPAAVVLTVGIMSLTGCGGGDRAGGDSMIDLSRLRTPDVHAYRLLQGEVEQARMLQRLEREELDGKDRFIATFTMAGGIAGETSVIFDEDSGRPVRLNSAERMQGMEATAEFTYEPGRVVRVMKTPARPAADTTITVVPSDVRDWMQMSYLLRAAELGDGDTLRIPFYQGFGPALVDTAVVVNLGDEIVTTPAGQFEVRHLHLAVKRMEAHLYIEDGPARRIIRHIAQRPGGAQLITELLPDSVAVAMQK